MKLKITKKLSTRVAARMKNKVRIRRKVNGTADRPRLAVYRSCKYIYAQIIDDTTGTTLAAASSVKQNKGSIEAAKLVGQEIAKKAIEMKIKDVVFDRSGYIYHGRIKGVAEGAREAGLNF